MGTLFKQGPRFGYDEKGRDTSIWVESVANDIAYMARRISKDCEIPLEEAFKCIELSLKIQDGDIKDEQLTGFGELIQKLIDVIGDKHD